MTEVEDAVKEYIKILSGWRAEPYKKITSVLTRIDETKIFRGQQLNDITDKIIEFHKEIAKADQGLVDTKWYELCINMKRRLKKMQETEEKQKKKKQKPQLVKKTSNTVVEYPLALTYGKGPTDQRILQHFFKSFVAYFDQAMTHPNIIQFLHALLKEIKFKFEDRNDDTMNKRIISICTRLGKESARESKGRMLAGQITPKQLSLDDEEIYFDQKTRENIKRIQLEEVERLSTGFYENMKKQINKDACEQCRFCRKKSAYCEDQKQIRASDEPMTRFMKCNACEKAWRD